MCVLPQPRRATRVGNESGFTLVELVTCIVIIGVLAAVAGPRFVSYQPFQQRGYIDEVAASMRYAQRVAIASCRNVLFTVGSTSYQAMQQATAGANCTSAGAWSTTVTRADASTLSGVAPSGVTMSPTAQIIFNSQGAVSSGPPPTLSVGSFSLQVNAGSGLVVVQ